MITIEKSKILAVEGKDECNFFDSFFNNFDISGVQIIDFGGKAKFNSKIRDLTKTPGFENVIKMGLVRDSDNVDPKIIFDSINAELSKLGYSQPTSLSEFTNDNPSIGIFIMPNNSDFGVLEDLCLKSVNSTIISCIKNLFECCTAHPKECSKAQVQCYLATCNPLVNSLGLGAHKNHWDFKDIVFEELNEFVMNFN